MNYSFKFNNQTYTINVWKPEHGKIGRIVAIDTETTMVPFYMTPDLVTFQAYSGGENVFYVERTEVELFLEAHKEAVFVGANFAFDNDVIEKHLDQRGALKSWYDNNNVRDVIIMYKLWHLADHGHTPFKSSLATVCKRFLGVELLKDETRENFSLFIHSKISDIPSNYLEYGAIDVIATYRAYFALNASIKEHDKMNTLLSHDIQIKGALALLHTYKNGIGVNLAAKDVLLAEMNTELEKHANILASWGWVRGKKGIKEAYESIMVRLGVADTLPRSDKSGELSSKSEDIEHLRSLQFVDSFLKYNSVEKASTFIRDLSSSRVHPRYNLLVNTGRTSCSSPNFQQLPRVGGIREAFCAEQGNVLLITDYSAIELSTLAQVCYNRYGFSEMRNRINAGEDLHRYYASIMNNCKPEEVTKQQRQEAKAANFGFPGGLGVETFIQFSRGYGLELTTEQAEEMKRVWFHAFPEMDMYMQNEVGHVFTETGRKRGDTSYCAEKNTPFQGLAADGAKIALYNLDRAGFKIVGFVHDEIITEVKKDEADFKLKLQEEIMVMSMKEVVTDVRVSVESEVSEHYTK